MKICKQCKNDTWKIEVREDCGDCEHNPSWSEDGYIYDQKIINESGLTRDGVENDGECAFGTAFGEGCYMFHCAKCGYQFTLAMMDN